MLKGGLGVLRRTMTETIETVYLAGSPMVPNHSHNMLLQGWAETGAVGASLFSLALLLARWRLSSRERNSAMLKGAALAGDVFAIACVSFDLWNDMFWAGRGLIAVTALATPRHQKSRERAKISIVFGAEPASASPSPSAAALAGLDDAIAGEGKPRHD